MVYSREAGAGRVWRFLRPRGVGVRQPDLRGSIDEEKTDRPHGAWRRCGLARAGDRARAHGVRGECRAPRRRGGGYTCTGGNVPPGTYSSIRITGVCYMPAGTIVVRGNLAVAPGALLDAVTPGDPPASPVVPATVLIGGNVFVGKGAVLLFGCSPNISCGSPPGISFDRIRGNLTAIGAQGVVVHSASIGGSASLLGGGGGAAAKTCNAQSPGTPPIADLEPWSQDPNLDQTPVYSDFEDSSIGGNLTVAGLTSCWLGSVRNQVRGNGTFGRQHHGRPRRHRDPQQSHGRQHDLPEQFAGGPVRRRRLGPEPGREVGIGECGFNVVLPNPAPEAGEGPGTPEHIAVSLRSLKTYFGTHTATFVDQAESVKTTSGYTITAVLNDFTLKGTGLTGSGTATPSTLPAPSGDAVLSTVYPDGSSSFIAYDSCDSCSFGGQTGTTTLRFYGTTSANGVTHGTFLVTFGGAVPSGELQTLAGWERSPAPASRPEPGGWSSTSGTRNRTASSGVVRQTAAGMSGVLRNSGHPRVHAALRTSGCYGRGAQA